MEFDVVDTEATVRDIEAKQAELDLIGLGVVPS